MVLDWAPDTEVQVPRRPTHTIAALLVSHGLWTVFEVPPELARRLNCDGPLAARSSACESLCLPLGISTFADHVRNTRIVALSDNTGYISAHVAVHSGSRFHPGPLDDNIAATTVLQAHTACFVHLVYVDTSRNLADPFARHLPQVGLIRCEEAHLPMSQSQTPPVFPPPDTFWPSQRN